MTARAKVLLIALDAAEKDLILEWAAAGWLPAVQALRARSACGVTLGPLGMHAAAVWHCFFTAVNPARHGRHADRQVRPGSYEMYRFRATDVKREPFWTAFSRAGRRLAVVDVPYAPLYVGINGLHIVDWTSHAADTGFSTAPPSLAGEVKARFGTDAVGLCDHLRIRSMAEIAAFRDALVARVRQKTALARDLLAQGGWDLFLIAFGESHCVGHQCWHVHDRGHPLHDPAIAQTVGDPIRDVYRALDTAIVELLEAAGSEATVFVVCSHGMGPNYHGAHLLGEILHRLGYGPPAAEPSPAWSVLRRAWRALPARIREPFIPLQKSAVDRTWPPLDGRYSCFDVPNGEVYGAIRINLAGREPLGCVPPGAPFDEFCTRLTRDLGAFINAETGRPAVRRVLRTADLYTGPYLDHLPDLLLEWDTGAPLNAVHSPRTGTIRRVLDGPRTGHHRREGLFLASGPGIRPGALRETVSIMDVGPTVAALLEVRLADVDGRPIPGIR